ncbi:reverse transcriptase family protein [Ixodes scapularis]
MGSYMQNFSERSVEGNWCLFKDKITSLITNYILCRVVKSNSKSPWYNTTLKRLSNKKKRLFRAAKSSMSPDRWAAYHSAAEVYKLAVDETKYNFFSIKLPSMLTNNPKQFWNLVNPADKHLIQLKNSGGEVISGEDCAMTFNESFISVFSDFLGANHPVLPSSDFLPMLPIVFDPPGIVKIIENLKLSSASGVDEINAKFLKNTKMYSSIILSSLFQQSLDHGVLPEDWKVGKVVPIHKAGDRFSPFNYRPISLTSVPCKIMEHIISSQLSRFLECNSFFSPFQHGFRKSFSCDTQLLVFTHNLHSALERGSQTDCIFLDFAKAFDKVTHKLLLYKLSLLSIDPYILSWLECFLTNRSQFVTVSNKNSSSSLVKSGVPQGSVLGPLLFLVYINDLPTSISSSISVFADDCVVYREITNDSDVHIIQSDINAISSWCDAWHMKLNTMKCKTMRISRKAALCPNYFLSNNILENVSTYKYLGVHISPDLSWKTHTEYIVNNSNRMLGYLRRNFSLAPSSLKLLLYNTLVRPKLEYACSVWDPGTESLISALEAIQNRSAPFILSNYHRTSSVTSMKASLSLPPLSTRRTISRLCLFHKIYYANSLLKEQLISAPIYVSSRLDHCCKVGIPTSISNSFFKSFIPKTSRDWNGLPSPIASIGDFVLFKEALTSYYS